MELVLVMGSAKHGQPYQRVGQMSFFDVSGVFLQFNFSES